MQSLVSGPARQPDRAHAKKDAVYVRWKEDLIRCMTILALGQLNVPPFAKDTGTLDCSGWMSATVEMETMQLTLTGVVTLIQKMNYWKQISGQGQTLF